MNKMSFSVGTPLWGVAALDEREVGDAPPAGLVNSTGSLYLLLPSDVGLIDGLDGAVFVERQLEMQAVFHDTYSMPKSV